MEEQGKCPASISSLPLPGAAEQLPSENFAGIVNAAQTAPASIHRRDNFDGSPRHRSGFWKIAGASGNDYEKRRLLRVRCCALWRSAAQENRAPEFFHVRRRKKRRFPAMSTSPAAEMERSFNAPTAYHADKLPAELELLPPERRVFAPDASQTPNISLCVKGALAAFICYLIFTMFAYQGFTPRSSLCRLLTFNHRASVKKGFCALPARFSADCLRGCTDVYFPERHSLGGFCFVRRSHGAGAYVHFGTQAFLTALSDRIASSNVLSKVTDLHRAQSVRDRFVGMPLVYRLWIHQQPALAVSALKTMRAKIGGTSFTLLARLPACRMLT